eukprot:2507176-Rhodomonas_salina.1
MSRRASCQNQVKTTSLLLRSRGFSEPGRDSLWENFFRTRWNAFEKSHASPPPLKIPCYPGRNLEIPRNSTKTSKVWCFFASRNRDVEAI